MSIGLEHDYRLRYMDFDRCGRMLPSALLDIFQDVATMQAESMGIGYDAMLEKGVFWVIVRMKYEIVREPERYQVVTARTWPHTLTRFSFLRDFAVCDQKTGDLLVKASSEWVLVDRETRKFASVAKLYEGPTDFDEARAFDAKAKKVPNFQEDPACAFTFVPTYSDIDHNGHVNNAKYGNYVVNALNPGEEGAIRTFQIDYRHELLPDEPVSVYSQVQDGLVLAKGVNADGEIAFASAIELR